MNTISAFHGPSGPIRDSTEVTVDWEAEPVDWDHAVARFLLSTVQRRLPPAAVEDEVIPCQE